MTETEMYKRIGSMLRTLWLPARPAEVSRAMICTECTPYDRSSFPLDATIRSRSLPSAFFYPLYHLSPSFSPLYLRSPFFFHLTLLIPPVFSPVFSPLYISSRLFSPLSPLTLLSLPSFLILLTVIDLYCFFVLRIWLACIWDNWGLLCVL